MVGYLEEAHGITVGFGQWMRVGVPLSVVMLVIAWFLLTKVLFRPEIDEVPGGRRLIEGGCTSSAPRRPGRSSCSTPSSWPP